MSDAPRDLIFRVANAKGQGPYVGSKKGWSSGWDPDRHPGPFRDGIDQRDFMKLCSSDYEKLFGFPTRAKLRDWFDDSDRRELKEEGFKMVTYEVDPKAVVYGFKQAVFDVSRAKLVNTEELI